MGPFDIPEALIGICIVAVLVWGAYNWTRRNVSECK
jgi:hypothetical protein